MFGLVKMSALSAVLSFAVVTTFDPPPLWAQGTQHAKPFQDRIASDDNSVILRTSLDPRSSGAFAVPVPVRTAKGDRLKTRPGHCADQTWPYLSDDCMAGAAGRPSRQVRVITVESRHEPNTSVLNRIPQTIAQR
jgi:hypothetical protein